MDFFNRQSNVDFNTRIVDFNLKDLPDSMLVFALINVCEAVRNRMYFNAKRNVRTWLYVEEMQSLFAYRRCSTTSRASPTRGASSACC